MRNVKEKKLVNAQ